MQHTLKQIWSISLASRSYHLFSDEKKNNRSYYAFAQIEKQNVQIEIMMTERTKGCLFKFETL